MESSSSPLLLLLDGILSQDENQTRNAIVAISRYVPVEVRESPLSSAPMLVRVVSKLLEKFPNLAQIPSSHGRSLPLHFAASIGNVDLASVIFHFYPPGACTPNDNGKIPLHYAAREGRTDMVTFMLRVMPDIAQIKSKKDKLALHFAAGEGHVGVVRALLHVHPKGASLPSGKGKVPLHFAARWGHLQIAQDLLYLHPDSISHLDWEGSLPLHDAARQGQLEMAKFLVERYPKALSVANIRGEIPLFPAVRSGNIELVVFLLQAWPYGGKFILRSVGEEDNVADWDDPILELCLRGAVGNFFGCPLLENCMPPMCFEDPDKPKMQSSLLVTQQQEQQNFPTAAALPASANKKNESSTPTPMGPIIPHTATFSHSHLPSLDITLPRSKSPILEHDGNKKKRSQSSSSFSAVDGENKRSRYESSIHEGICDSQQTKAISKPVCVPFIHLHAALECGATSPVLNHILDTYPEQLGVSDANGQLPLHLVVVSDSSCCRSAASDGFGSRRIGKNLQDNKMIDIVVERILKPNPEAACIQCPPCGRLPLHQALISRVDCKLIQALLEANPSAGVERCLDSDQEYGGKLPLHIASENDCDLTTIYLLLRGDPSQLKL